MKFLFLFLIVGNAFACENEVREFLKKKSPLGSEIEIQKGDDFIYTVRFQNKNGSYQDNGVLNVSSDCKISVKNSQVQKSGKVSVPEEKTAKPESDSMNLSGTWKSQCIQMQNSSHQGYVTEAYTFTDKDEVSFTRNWYKSANCKGKVSHAEKENGKIILGESQTNNGFNPAGTREITFEMKNGSDKGVIWMSDERDHLRLSRGFGGSANTMLSLTQYKR